MFRLKRNLSTEIISKLTDYKIPTFNADFFKWRKFKDAFTIDNSCPELNTKNRNLKTPLEDEASKPLVSCYQEQVMGVDIC